MNSQVTNNYAGTLALIQVEQNAQLSISDGTFEDIYSLGRGSVIFSEKKNSVTLISNTSFKNNYAYIGGVFFSQIYGYIECTNCTITDNFAIVGGVLYSQNQGSATFIDSHIENNVALRSSIIFVINQLTDIVISGGTITKNGLYYSDLLNDLALFNFINQTESYSKLIGTYGFKQNYIDLIYNSYKTELQGYTTYEQQTENPQIQLIKAMITFKDNATFTDQLSLVTLSSGSELNTDGLIFTQIPDLQGPLIHSEQSALTINKLYITNITTSYPLLNILSESSMTLTNCFITQVTGPIIYSKDAETQIHHTIISNVTHDSNEYSVITLTLATLTSAGLSIQNIAYNRSSNPIIALSNSDAQFSALQAQGFDSKLLYLDSSTFYMNNSIIQKAETTDSGLALEFYRTNAEIFNSTFTELMSSIGPAIYSSDIASSASSKTLKLTNCKFINNSATLQGGAVFIKDIDATIKESFFESNQASQQNGGAVYISCSPTNTKKCNVQVLGNNFTMNKAELNGGSIYYDLYSPVNLINNTYLANQAQYGPNYASYPFKLQRVSENGTIIPSTEKFTLVSGQTLDYTIYVALFDQNDQLIETDTTSYATLTTNDLTLTLSQNNKVQAVNGVFAFPDMEFIGDSNYTSNIVFQTDSIDSSKYALVTGQEFQAFFRECITGEITFNKMCVECSKETYSFTPTNSQCDPCFENGLCLGKNITEALPGYWRSQPNRTVVFECPYETSCLGGYESECLTGYEGRLCSVCVKEINGTKYARSGQNQCAKCQELYLQILSFIGIFLLLAAYIVYILQQTINPKLYSSILSSPKRNKPQTVLVRIITNYLQAILIVREFEMNWPRQVKEALDAFSFVSSQQESVFSLDCIYSQTTELTINIFYLKVIVFGVLPFILAILGTIVWGLLYLCFKGTKSQFNLRRNVTVTVFVFIFLCYPIITNNTFALFSCQTLEDNISYLKKDYTVQCWSGDHAKMALLIGLPFCIFWVLGFPLYITYCLYKRRKDLDKDHNIIMFGLYFVGINDHSFYWEILVVNSRKIIFILCGTLLSTLDNQVKALLAIIVLMVQTQLLHYRAPYIDPRFNYIETLSTYAAALTLYGGIFFIEKEVQAYENALLFLFIAILFFNIYFLGVWAYRFIEVMLRLHAAKFKKFKCCVKIMQKLNIVDYESNLKESLARALTRKQAQIMAKLKMDGKTEDTKKGSDFNKSIVSESQRGFLTKGTEKTIRQTGPNTGKTPGGGNSSTRWEEEKSLDFTNLEPLQRSIKNKQKKQGNNSNLDVVQISQFIPPSFPLKMNFTANLTFEDPTQYESFINFANQYQKDKRGLESSNSPHSMNENPLALSFQNGSYSQNPFKKIQLNMPRIEQATNENHSNEEEKKEESSPVTKKRTANQLTIKDALDNAKSSSQRNRKLSDPIQDRKNHKLQDASPKASLKEESFSNKTKQAQSPDQRFKMQLIAVEGSTPQLKNWMMKDLLVEENMNHTQIKKKKKSKPSKFKDHDKKE